MHSFHECVHGPESLFPFRKGDHGTIVPHASEDMPPSGRQGSLQAVQETEFAQIF